MRVTRKIGAIVAASFIVALTGALLFTKMGRSARADGSPYPTAFVSIGGVRKTLRVSGRVRPRRTTEVKSPFSGRVVELFVTGGERVKAGHRIASIEPEQGQSLLLSRARVDVELRKLELQRAERAHNRARELGKAGLVAAHELENAHTAVSEATQALGLARQQLATMERQLPRSLTPGSTTFVIVAPVDGTVLSVQVSPGETIVGGTTGVASGGTVVARLADTAAFIVRVEVNEMDVMKIRRGMRAVIKPSALSRTLRGHVERIAAEGTTEQNVTVFPADVVVDENIDLLAQLSCDVDVIVAEQPGVLRVPNAALVHHGEQTIVFKPGAKEFTRVQTGLIGDEYSEIVAGLEPGERVELRAIASTPPDLQ